MNLRTLSKMWIAIPALAAALAPMAEATSIDQAMQQELQSIRFEAPDDPIGTPPKTKEIVSRQKAFLRSLILPGWGQHYTGNKTRSKIFLGLEAAIWTTFIVYQSREILRTDDFEEHAESFAGIDAAGKDEEYFRIMTIFNSSEEYNTAVRADARTIFGTASSDAKDQYIAENSFVEDRAYQWKSNERRLQYRIIRNNAREAGQRANFALVAAVLNHAISAVEAARGASGSDRLSRAVGHLQVIPPASHEPPLIRFAWRTDF